MNNVGRLIETAWLDLPHHHAGVAIDAFIVMPDHVHGILAIYDDENFAGTAGCAPTDSDNGTFGNTRKHTLPVIVRSFKSATARQIRAVTGCDHVWQRGYFDHIIRGEHDLNVKRRYIATNVCR